MIIIMITIIIVIIRLTEFLLIAPPVARVYTPLLVHLYTYPPGSLTCQFAIVNLPIYFE